MAFPSLSAAFTRGALSLTDLVTTNTPAFGLYLPEDAIGEVGWDFRRSYAPDSPWQPGRRLLAAVREASTLPLVIYAKASSGAALEDMKAELEAAAAQWAYDVTITADSVVATYHCEPAIPRWGALDSGMAAAHMARGVLVIPVNP